MTADSGEGTGPSIHDRLHAVEDELCTPWTLLTAALDELAGTIVDVDGRAAIELARRTALRVQQVAEAFLAGNAIPDAPGGDATAPGQATDATGTRLRVLIADDNADLRAYLATMLAAKYAIDTVSDGAALVAAARTQRPDVIVSDARMPFIDGFEAARMLREDPRTADIPIVLLSGKGGDEAADAAIDAGVDDYLVKPFTVAELIARVDALARRRSAFRETADAVAGADVNGSRESRGPVAHSTRSATSSCPHCAIGTWPTSATVTRSNSGASCTVNRPSAISRGCSNANIRTRSATARRSIARSRAARSSMRPT